MLNFLPLFDESLEKYKKGDWLRLVTLASALSGDLYEPSEEEKTGQSILSPTRRNGLALWLAWSLTHRQALRRAPSCQAQTGRTHLEDFGESLMAFGGWGWGQRAEACGEAGAPEGLGSRAGRGSPGQQGALGACGRLATLFTRDQTQLPECGRAPGSKDRPTTGLGAPSMGSLSPSTWPCVGEGACGGAGVCL